MFVADAVAATKMHIGAGGKLTFDGNPRVVIQAGREGGAMFAAATRAYAAKAEARAGARKIAIAAQLKFAEEQKALIDAKRAQDVEGARNPSSLVSAEIQG